ncbi:MAG: hypothetical protein FVQ83_10100 [Chloroflexi bacterium]|nr:hypothetical protein [Chloroflexota bacterium]
MDAKEIVRLLIRVIHILAGVVWAGGLITMARFISPVVEAIGEAGKEFMAEMNRRRIFQITMSSAAGLTILSGLVMYISKYERLAPLTTLQGLAITAGSLFGILAFATASMMQSRSLTRLRSISQEIGASGGPPSQEQAAEIESLQETIAKGGALATIFMVLSVIGMALS